MRINFNAGQRKPQGVFAQVVTAIVGVVVLIGAAMFSLVFLAVIAVAGLIFWIYFWWKTRAIRAQIEQQMRAQAQYRSADPQAATPASEGDVIDGEAVRIVETDRMLGGKSDPQP